MSGSREERDLFRAPYGTRDVLPPESDRWQELVARFADRARRFGYGLLVTPIFEHAEVFHRVGESTDVVSKEMYEFEDRGGRRLALRPEGTASVVRAFVQHHPAVPWKCWYIAPNFRAERPQKGRYRQHYQVGAEVLGVDDPDVDVEVIALLDGFLRDLGLTRFRLLVNSMGDVESRASHRVALLDYLRGHTDVIGAEERAELNPLRILDSKRADWQDVLDGAPRLADHLTPETAAHFERVQEGLRALEIPFEIAPRLVRGFDYYTHDVRVPERHHRRRAERARRRRPLRPARRGDGRAPTPSIGFGGRYRTDPARVRCRVGVSARPRLADRGVRRRPHGHDRRRGAAQRAPRPRARRRPRVRRTDEEAVGAADKAGATFGVMLAPAETAAGKVAVKDLRSGEQVEVERTEVADWLLARIGAGAVSPGMTAQPMPRRGSTRP